MSGTEFLFWICMSLVSVASAARITRLLTYDVFPPVVWARNTFAEFVDKWAITRPWGRLAYCVYCMSFWVAGGVLLAGYLSDWHTAWWLINGAFALSYPVALFVDLVDPGDPDDPDRAAKDDESPMTKMMGGR